MKLFDKLMKNQFLKKERILIIKTYKVNYKNNLSGTVSKSRPFFVSHVLQWGGLFTVFTPRMTSFMISGF